MQSEGLDTMTVGAIQEAFDDLRRERDEARNEAREARRVIEAVKRDYDLLRKEIQATREQWAFEARVIVRILEARRDNRHWSHSDRDTIDELLMHVLGTNTSTSLSSVEPDVNDIPF